MPPLIGYAAASGTLNWERGSCLRFCSSGSSRISTRSPGCIARITSAPAPYAASGGAGWRIHRSPDFVCYSLILIPISLVPKFLSMAGNLYLAGALVLGLLFPVRGRAVMFDRLVSKRTVFLLASVVYCRFSYGLMLLDRPA